MNPFFTLFVFLLVSFQLAGAYVFNVNNSPLDIKIGVMQFGYKSFIPHNLYMSLYQAEISPTNPRILSRTVKYLLVKSSRQNVKNLLVRVPRLSSGDDYHTTIFMTLSLDIEGKYIVDTFQARFKTFNSLNEVVGFHQKLWMMMGVYDTDIEAWPETTEKLTPSGFWSPRLNANQAYLITFFKYSSALRIYFWPDADPSYRIPKYAEIRLSLINSNGKEISNPAPINDIIMFGIVPNPKESQITGVPIHTTEYMMVLSVLTEIRSKN
ncbi:hypothetical protein RF11_13205 [Thelohanellus kitauei]|uniref:Uncharacterized protein n=1 Tax=Thelohanellus kitauei TaxID=669202 RepID=A0A0C2IIN6_THEKT|nr:hypothetical protein RF11_13205 [Thelohanellus kitauei]